MLVVENTAVKKVTGRKISLKMWQALVFIYEYHYGAQGNGT